MARPTTSRVLALAAGTGVLIFSAAVLIAMRATNLLGDEYEAYQARGGDRVDVDVYDIGTSISFGLKRRF